MIVPLLRMQSLLPAIRPLAYALAPRRILPLRTSSHIFFSSDSTTEFANKVTPDDVLHFWFEDLTPAQWFQSDDALDNTIRDKFQDTLEKASMCELDNWRTSPDGALAEIIVLDQFSRNIYRSTPQSFAQDSLALALAQEAIAKGFNKKLKPPKLGFLYMPFMHSESRAMHERAMKLYDAPGMGQNFEFEKKHKVIIDKFGRYPHRNEVLGRQSTREEVAFLNEPDSSF